MSAAVEGPAKLLGRPHRPRTTTWPMGSGPHDCRFSIADRRLPIADSGQFALAECVLGPSQSPIANRQSLDASCGRGHLLTPAAYSCPGQDPGAARSGQPGGDAWKELAFAGYNTRNRLIPQSGHPLPAAFGSPSLESRGSPQRSLQGIVLFLREDFQSAGRAHQKHPKEQNHRWTQIDTDFEDYRTTGTNPQP